jgi:hypothetical protein
MSFLSTSITASVFALTMLCANAQSNERERRLWAATPVDNSWTNQVIVTRFDTFPITGNLKPDIGFAPYDTTNSPSFMLFKDGMIYLEWNFAPKGKPPAIGLFYIKFHVSQSLDVADKFEMFKSHSSRLVDAGVFPATLPLGEVHPDRSSPDKGRHFRFTVYVSQKAEPKLLLEDGDTPIVMGGEPSKYDLNVLSEQDAQMVLKLLRGLPNYTWWKQKELGIIPPPSTK